MIIWLDDLRDPKDYGCPDALWIKNSVDFNILLIDCLIKDKDDDIEAIHFDNDLGEETEGYDLFLKVEEDVYKGKLKGLKKIFVHTSNPSAAKKFMLAKESFSRYGVSIIRNNY